MPPTSAQRVRLDSLGDGAAGELLVKAQQVRLGLRPWHELHDAVRALTRDPVAADPESCGLFRGAPAVAFALHTARHPGYEPSLSRLDKHIATIVEQRLAVARARINRGALPALREFDLISGLTGLGAYLLNRSKDGELLRDVLRYLVRLTHPLTSGDDLLPGWWTSHGPSDQADPNWIGGHGNVGIAHGIAGPLSLLAHSQRRGVTVDGQAEAMRRILAWIDDYRICDAESVRWPGLVSRAEHREPLLLQSRHPERPSWCYGTPGIARAQQLAGVALDDCGRQRLAELALLDCVCDDRQLDLLEDASLCHGSTGLLLTTWRCAREVGADLRLAEAVPRLRNLRGQRVQPSHAGLLEGVTGLRLAENTIGDPEDTTRWDACLLLTAQL
ncbi:lanthionine synthetase C family protein [Nocardioides speluncae]|uniref:lanthionine synthetase C family protein n=1 Tax=Nocardioides speluncae TaxID=2670337 RepID=UPI000D69E857|nr:lanthionine synthetase C family protein [Nocardioides speluncae]